MPQLTFEIKSKVDVNQIISASDLKRLFLAGIPIDKLDTLPDETLDFYINAARDYIEQELTILLNKQIVTENQDFDISSWQHWNHIRVNYPAVYCLLLQGFLGTTKQVDYPSRWLVCKKDSTGKLYSRNIAMVPTQNATSNELVIYSGIMPNAGFFTGQRNIPTYWTAQYITGFDVIPPAIINAIGMLAAMPILMLLNDLIVKGNRNFPGIGFGVTNNSISLDGLSQSSGSYVNGNSTIFGAKIKEFKDLLFGDGKRAGMIEDLRNFYGSIIWGVA